MEENIISQIESLEYNIHKILNRDAPIFGIVIVMLVLIINVYNHIYECKKTRNKDINYDQIEEEFNRSQILFE